MRSPLPVTEPIRRDWGGDSPLSRASRGPRKEGLGPSRPQRWVEGTSCSSRAGLSRGLRVSLCSASSIPPFIPPLPTSQKPAPPAGTTVTCPSAEKSWLQGFGERKGNRLHHTFTNQSTQKIVVFPASLGTAEEAGGTEHPMLSAWIFPTSINHQPSPMGQLKLLLWNRDGCRPRQKLVACAQNAILGSERPVPGGEQAATS